MSITAVLVLFSIIWFLVLFLTLQIKIKTQGGQNHSPSLSEIEELFGKKLI